MLGKSGKKKEMFSIEDFPLHSKTVLLRVDYNVPINKNKVTNNSRIRASLPTIKYLLSQNCKIVILTHLGRPNGKIVPELNVGPLAKELQKLLPKTKVIKLNNCIGEEIKQKINLAKSKQIIMLENLRFYKEEEENDLSFAHSLATLGDVYINDAFSNSHREHASMDAITLFLPAVAGLLMEKEIKYLSQALSPKKPTIWIMGGAKLDKTALLEQAFKNAENILVGGALAFSFLKTKGILLGMSKTDLASVEIATKIMESRNASKIILPVDFVVADSFSRKAKTSIASFNEIKTGQMALDIGPKTVELFKSHLSKAKTIIWNGPLGYCEWAPFALATKEIGRYLGKINAIKIAGGGETEEVLEKFQLLHNFTHVSTGGGAALSFLSGDTLPGILALRNNYKKFN